MAKPKIQRYTQGEAAIFVNAYLIETPKGVIVVDSSLTVSGGKTLNKMVKDTKKTFHAVLLTHGHPDHYNGVVELVKGFDNVPVISTQGVHKVIKDHDAEKEKMWKPMFGAEWPEKRMFPTKIVSDKEILNFDGISFTVHDLGKGESHADSYWVIEYDGNKEAFIGDIVLNKVHAYLNDGHSSEWLKNIEKIKQQNFDLLYPGHGEPGKNEILNWQKQYIEIYRKKVAQLSKGKPILGDAEKKELVAEMKKFLADNKLEMLITLSADAIAKELAK